MCSVSCNETALHGARYRVEEGNVLRARVAAESGRWAGPGSLEALGRPGCLRGARSLAQLQQRRKQLVFKRGQTAEEWRRAQRGEEITVILDYSNNIC